MILIAAILFMPDGILPRLLQRAGARGGAAPARSRAGVAAAAGRASRRARRPARARRRRCCASRGLRKRFKGVQALAGVDLDVRRGEILGLLGPNGSGKSTFINVVSGHYAPSAGAIVLRGRATSRGSPAHRIAARRRRAHLPDPAPVRAPERARQRGAARRCSAARRSTARAARARGDGTGSSSPASPARRDALPDELNLHQRKFLELARALASRPRLLLLDEVLSGLTPSEIDDAIALIRRIRDQGATIVFVEHVMRAVMELSDRIVVLQPRRAARRRAAPREVMREPSVMTAYLGKAHA